MRRIKDILEQHREKGRFKPVVPRYVPSVAVVSPRPSSDSANVKLKEDGGLAQNTLLDKKKKPMSPSSAEISFQSVKEMDTSMKEAKDEKEYGYEGDMAMNQLKTITRHAEYLMEMMKPDTDLPEWVQSKITLAADYIQTACDYMTSEMNESVEQIDEISDTTLGNYITAARKDRETNKINKSAPDTAQRASANERDKKRIAGMNKAKSYLTPGTAGHAKNQARRAMHEDAEQIEEAVSVKKQDYSWGKMVTVHHGADTSYPLHPEHQEKIKNLKDGEKTSFKDETNSTVHAHREGESVHLTRPKTSSTKTTVAHSHFTESVDYDKVRADAADHLKKSIDKQSDDRIAALKNPKKPESFLAKVGRKQINMVKGAWHGLTKESADKDEDDVPFDKPYKKVQNDVVTDKSGAKHGPMSRARNLARMAALQQQKLSQTEQASFAGRSGLSPNVEALKKSMQGSF